MGIQLILQKKTPSKPPSVPKNKDTITEKSQVIYRYKCDSLECDKEYIGESTKKFGEGLQEHLRAPSPMYGHANITGHHIIVNIFSIMGRNSQNPTRTINDTIYIRVNDQSPYRNTRKFQLPHR